MELMNRKPFRPKELKVYAKTKAQRCKDGAYRSPVPRSFHTSRCIGSKCVCRGSRPSQEGGVE